jgi:hypothetical protein
MATCVPFYWNNRYSTSVNHMYRTQWLPSSRSLTKNSPLCIPLWDRDPLIWPHNSYSTSANPMYGAQWLPSSRSLTKNSPLCIPPWPPVWRGRRPGQGRARWCDHSDSVPADQPAATSSSSSSQHFPCFIDELLNVFVVKPATNPGAFESVEPC